ncbi:Mrp/NBP35 family ATP-binding protein [uncultured Cetobacterium sp.]|uniref:Mrp/NBP35 family ATP-binding protein n=2 Tax=uncultured Cetobacterium sp. TaxID=527638 RepID=UPI0026132D96|nr:Mrp/NBP35 family ATP-binding protein [uncultured Cetobacterium sp.]
MSNCNSCPSQSNCSKESTKCGVTNNPLNKIKYVIGVMSGKGGVGKSTISSLIARELNNKGFKVGVMDADITGPSIPRLMGLSGERADGVEENILPVISKDGIKTMSLNYLIENENDPVVWRGPMVGKAVEQFWNGVIWGELDYLIIDMPPGTGDVALTVMQSIPLSGVVMVSIPQDMISMIVTKAIKMTKQLNTPVLGIIENMSYISCPGCNTKIQLFNENHTKDFIEECGVPLLGELPMVNSICNLSNNSYEKDKIAISELFSPIVDKLIKTLK